MWVKRYKIYLGLFKVTVDFQNNFLCVTFKIVLPHVCCSDSNRKKDTISLKSSDGKGCWQFNYIVIFWKSFLHRTNELTSLKLPDVSYHSLWVKGFLPNAVWKWLLLASDAIELIIYKGETTNRNKIFTSSHHRTKKFQKLPHNSWSFASSSWYPQWKGHGMWAGKAVPTRFLAFKRIS